MPKKTEATAISSNSISQNSKPDSTANKQEILKFLTYGEMPGKGYADAEIEITKKYGFIIENPYGCVVTDSLLQAIKSQNLKSATEMEKKYGKNWIQDFEKKTGLIFSVPNIEKE